MNKIHKIVLTGGPCAGKSSAMKHLEEKLVELGFKVVLVEEAATIILSSYNRNELSSFELQKLIFEKILELEAKALQVADVLAKDSNVVVIFDRGILDNKAYITKDEMNELMQHFSTNESEVLKRYDAIVHLVTAADGAEEFYTLANNNTRSESVELARELDIRTMNAWVGHSKITVIDNKGTFQEKLDETFVAVTSQIGHPTPMEVERKFLFQGDNLSELLEGSSESLIEQTYLLNDDGHVERVRTITTLHGKNHYHTIKKSTTNKFSVIEEEREIDPSEYQKLIALADPARKKIVKKRHYKFFGRNYFSIDIHHNKNIVVLEIEFGSEKDAIEFKLPQILVEKYKVVEGGDNLSNYSLSQN